MHPSSRMQNRNQGFSLTLGCVLIRTPVMSVIKLAQAVMSYMHSRGHTCTTDWLRSHKQHLLLTSAVYHCEWEISETRTRPGAFYIMFGQCFKISTSVISAVWFSNILSCLLSQVKVTLKVLHAAFLFCILFTLLVCKPWCKEDITTKQYLSLSSLYCNTAVSSSCFHYMSSLDLFKVSELATTSLFWLQLCQHCKCICKIFHHHDTIEKMMHYLLLWPFIIEPSSILTSSLYPNFIADFLLCSNHNYYSCFSWEDNLLTFMFSGCSETLKGNFFKFGSNVHVESRMN